VATTRRPPPKPVDNDGITTVVVGTVFWVLAFLALLPFRDRLAADGRDWWLWTCAVGVGLGVIGLVYCRRRRTAIRRDRKRAAEERAATLREPLS
jgi:Tfp pilus assembly protein PilX